MSNQRNNMPNNNRVDAPSDNENKRTDRQLARLNHNIETISNEYKSANSDQNGHNKKALTVNWLTFWAAAFYSLLTVGILSVNVYQLKLLVEGGSETKRSVDAAEKSATAATRQAEIAADTERRQLRAYVGVIPEGISDFGDPKKHTLHMRRQNFGLTPAYNLTWTKLGMFVIKKGDPLPMAGQLTPHVDKLQTLFPSASLNLNIVGQGLSEQAINEVKINNKILVYFGSINYVDAFGLDHFTNYCFIFSAPNGVVSDADYCLGNNNSD